MTYSAKYEMIKVLHLLGKNWDTSCVYGRNGTFGYFLDYPSADSSVLAHEIVFHEKTHSTFAHYVKTEKRITYRCYIPNERQCKQ